MPVSPLHHMNLAGGKFKGTSRSDLDKLFAALQYPANSKKHLLIHFHGGLVNQKNAKTAITDVLMPAYGQDYCYPVFFIWQTGVFEVLKNNLDEIFSEKVFKKLKKRILKLVLSKLRKKFADEIDVFTTKGVDSIELELEINENDQEVLKGFEEHIEEIDELDNLEKALLEQELRYDQELELEIDLIANGIQQKVTTDPGTKGLTIRASKKSLMDPELFMEVDAESKATGTSKGFLTFAKVIKAAVTVAIKIIKRYRNKTHHGLYPTIIEELLRKYYLANAGKLIWDVIKKDTKDAFGKDDQIHGGTAFLQSLIKHGKSGHKPVITLVGHSAGSIYICSLLEQANKLQLDPDIRFNLVLLAPACTMKLFSKTITDHGNRINNIRIFGMKDDVEQKDKMLSFVYPRSLLYFVSGLLEEETDEPLLGMQRYYLDKTPHKIATNQDIKTVLQYLQSKGESPVWSVVTGEVGKESESIKHGDFDNNPLTLSSLMHLIKTNDYK